MRDTAHNPVRKVRILLLMARLLDKQSGYQQEAAQLVKQATVVTSLIERASDKDEALSDLASSLAQAQQWETLLAIIQHSWKSTQTYQEALSLFTLAFNFFSTAPLLGKRLHAAFVWINSFLRT